MEVFATGEVKFTVMDVRWKKRNWITEFFLFPYEWVVIIYSCVNMQDQKVLVAYQSNRATFQGIMEWIPLVCQRKLVPM